MVLVTIYRDKQYSSRHLCVRLHFLLLLLLQFWVCIWRWGGRWCNVYFAGGTRRQGSGPASCRWEPVMSQGRLILCVHVSPCLRHAAFREKEGHPTPLPEQGLFSCCSGWYAAATLQVPGKSELDENAMSVLGASIVFARGC